jgi:hypothetical protein
MTRWLFAFLAAVGPIAAAGSMYQRVEKRTAPSLTRIYVNDTTGDVHLVDSTDEDTSVPRWTEAVSDPKIASDKLTAGWLLEDRAGTSYTVPQGLAVYRSGRVLRTFAPSDWPIIVAWAFFANGKQVGFSSSALHGAESERRSYELHDIQTGRLQSWDDQRSGKAPAWVQTLSDLERTSRH